MLMAVFWMFGGRVLSFTFLQKKTKRLSTKIGFHASSCADLATSCAFYPSVVVFDFLRAALLDDR